MLTHRTCRLSAVSATLVSVPSGHSPGRGACVQLASAHGLAGSSFSTAERPVQLSTPQLDTTMSRLSILPSLLVSMICLVAMPPVIGSTKVLKPGTFTSSAQGLLT